MPADIFVSYAREDGDRVREFAAELTRLGWTVWWDDRIRTGAEFDEEIERELDAASCVIVVWSRSSLASGWVRAEAAAANDQGKLVPTRFDTDVVPPLRFRQINTASVQPDHLALGHGDTRRLLAEIYRLTGKPPHGIEPESLAGDDTGTASGARIVTAGRWQLTTRFLGARAFYDLELHPSGMASGKGGWFVSRADFAGRWLYDPGTQVLQLELSGGISEGIEAVRVEITEWLDDNTAACRFMNRKARLQRVGG